MLNNAGVKEQMVKAKINMPNNSWGIKTKKGQATLCKVYLQT